MSHRQCIFGVPAEIDSYSLCEFIADAMYAYDNSDFSSLFIACDRKESVMESGIRLFVVGSTDREWYLDREEFVEALSSNSESPLLTLLHDDEELIYVFEETIDGETTKLLISNGPYLSGDIEVIDIEYSQKGFSNDELSLLTQRSRRELTEKEQRALFDYDNALDIALRQWYPAIEFPNHLRLLSTSDTFAVIGGKVGASINRPKIWYNIFNYLPSDSDWSRSDLANPYYDDACEDYDDAYEDYDDAYEEFGSF